MSLGVCFAFSWDKCLSVMVDSPLSEERKKVRNIFFSSLQGNICFGASSSG